MKKIHMIDVLYVLAILASFTILFNIWIHFFRIEKVKRINELEKAYFEGQKDYALGNIKIECSKDSVWVWVGSPWRDGTKPIFNPNLIEDKK